MKLRSNSPVLLGSVLLLACLSVGSAHAERSHELGNFIVHYNAMPTDALDISVARTYAIHRARNVGILNVAVARKQPGGKTSPVTAMVSAHVTDHRGHISEVHMREIRDGEAIYYVGEFEIRSHRPLRFRLDVSPENATPPYMLTFEKQFMVD